MRTVPRTVAGATASEIAESILRSADPVARIGRIRIAKVAVISQQHVAHHVVARKQLAGEVDVGGDAGVHDGNDNIRRSAGQRTGSRDVETLGGSGWSEQVPLLGERGVGWHRCREDLEVWLGERNAWQRSDAACDCLHICWRTTTTELRDP